MPEFTVHIELFEDGEYIIEHDTYKGENGHEVAREAEEDYPGAKIHLNCFCQGIKGGAR